MKQFRDRADAGQQLVARLVHYANRDDVIVLALPRGGVPVAYEIARALGAPLDVMLVRKLGAPGMEELAIGAIASGNVVVTNDEIVDELKISASEIEQVAARERRELGRRERIFRGNHPPLPVRARTAILVDDGLATGATMRAAIATLEKQSPARIVIAVPTAPSGLCDELKHEVDEFISLLQVTGYFYAVSTWYEDFPQVADEEVRALLARARREQDAQHLDLLTFS